jgi:uncharacterized RDD family membrane protein YckC
MEKRVGFGPRLLAALIDVFVVLAATVGIGGTIGGLLGGGVGGAIAASDHSAAAAGAAIGAFLGAVLGAMAAFSVFSFLYSLIEAFTGASPGKMLLRLKVGLEDCRPAPVGTYLARWIVKYSGSVLGLVGVVPGLHVVGLLASAAGLAVFLGCFLVLGDKRQALHDLAAKTAVFRKADLTP